MRWSNLFRFAMAAAFAWMVQPVLAGPPLTTDHTIAPSDRITLSLRSPGNVILKTETASFGTTQGIGELLTVTIPGTRATSVEISQVQGPNGTGVVYFGEAGRDTSIVVETSGGTPNRVEVSVRHAATSAFENDLEIVAVVFRVGQASLLVSAIEASIEAKCVFRGRDGRRVRQTLHVTPSGIEGLQFFNQTFAVHVDKAAPTELFKLPAWSEIIPGEFERTISPSCADAYLYDKTSTSPPGEPPPSAIVSDVKENSNSDCDGSPDCGPIPRTSDGNSTRPGCAMPDSPRSVDLSDGQKKIDETDLVIAGRFPYVFRRVLTACPPHPRVNDFGQNWTYSYANEQLVKDGSGNDEDVCYMNFRAGQSGSLFVNIGPGQWGAPLSNFLQLRINPHTEDFEIREGSGTVRIYHNFSDQSTPNRNGRLKEIRDRNDNRLTCHYEQIDTGITLADAKFVLAFVIDTMGREIRYQYYASTSQTIDGRVVTITHPTDNVAAYGRLARVIDFKGNMDFEGDAESEDFPGQVNNRTLVFDYDQEGNLVRCSRPAIAATPQGNDFSVGKTKRYAYITEADLPLLVPGWDDLSEEEHDEVRERSLHKVTHIWDPNEVRDAVDGNPPDEDAVEIITYETDPSDAFFGFVTTYTVGGTNGNSVPSGGTIEYTWTDLNPTHAMPGGVSLDPTLLFNVQSHRVEVTDGNGNEASYVYGGGATLLDYREKTRDFRAIEPDEYLTKYGHNKDRLLRWRRSPELNQWSLVYNEDSTDRSQQCNLIREVKLPDLNRGGDQSKIETVYVYEPIYNRPCLIIYGRGADIQNNDFTPPIDDPASRTMQDPYDPTRTVDLRYARVEFFDFQESPENAVDAPDDRLDIDGSEGRVNESPLIGVDPDVLTTEVWLVQELWLPEDADGLNELRSRLSTNLTALGLGDLNGDCDNTPIIAGNIVRTVLGSPVLLEGSNQNALETAIETAGDLISESLPYIEGGAFEGAHGGRLQTIVTMSQYNQLGQITKVISPEANVATFEYFPEIDPDGDASETPDPADGRILDETTGGYLSQHVVDADRSYCDQFGNLLTGSFSNNNTDPPETDITTSYTYDDVGKAVSMTNGRGIRTDYFVNEHNEAIQTISAAEISGASDADPSDPLIDDRIGPLTAFAYISRTFFDFNGNVVLSQTEDRGNTSEVDGSGLGGLPMQATGTTPGLASADTVGGEAFVDMLILYDRLNNLIETRVEVDNTHSLDTRFRYDRNQNPVMTILPEGNAAASIYDERDLVFESTRGANEQPKAGLFAPDDPSTFNRPGGEDTEPSTTTYNYDLNRNLTELVDADDTDGDSSNNSEIAGVGDVTRYTYDGYDRRRTVQDADGNTSTYSYDPDDNVVRVVQNGDPIDDVVGESDNRTLAVTEYIYDSLSRVVITHQVLFETPDVEPIRTPVLTDDPDMDALAAYLADAPSDTATVPGALGITVIGRVTSLGEYDRQSRTTFAVQDDLDTYRTDHDGASRVIKTTDSALDNGFAFSVFDPAAISGNTVELAHDDNDNTIEQLEKDVTEVPDVPEEQFRTTYLYDSLDRLQTITDSIGQTHDYRYDSRSNHVAAADAVAPLNTRTINRRGLGSDDSVAVNDFGNVTRNFYDGINRALETQSVLTESTEGDGVHIGATLEGIKADIPTPDLDQSEDGLIDTYQAWDDNSQLIARRDDDGNTTGSVYDNQNRMICEVRGLGHPDYTFTAFSAITCPSTGLIGDGGAFNVDLRNGPPPPDDPPIDTEPAGTDLNYTFDRDNNIVTFVDEAGNAFDCTFDALNRKKTCNITRAAGFIGTTAQAWLYDGLSRQTFCIDDNVPLVDGDFAGEDDVTCTYAFDSLSRRIEETQQVGSFAAVNAISCDYDVENAGIEYQSTSTTYPDGRRVVSTFDTLDRLVSRADEGFQNDPIAVYSYIGAGRVATLTYQNGTRLTYIGQELGENADVGYDGLRRVINKRLEQFDAFTPLGEGDLVVGFGHQFGSPLGEAPAYDRVNNKLIEEKLHSPDNSEVYSYDSLYRVVDFKRGTLNAAKNDIETFTPLPDALQSQEWTLDGVHNWKANEHVTNGIPGTESRTHSDFNEILEVTGDRYGEGVPGVQEFDENGNLTDDNRRLLKWDALKRLREARRDSDNALIGEYTYDCMGRRFRRVVSNGGLPDDPDLNGTTEYFYDNWQVIEEQDGSGGGGVTQQYIYGLYIDEALVLDRRDGGAISIAELNDHSGRGDQRLFYHCNTQYSVFALTTEGGGPNPPGEIVEGYQYDAYGRQTVFSPGDNGAVDFGGDDDVAIDGSSANANPYMYTGRRYDPETGWYYYRTRYLDSIAGRFTTRDSIGIGGDRVNLGNAYAYAGGAPVNRLDSLGLFSFRSFLRGVANVVAEPFRQVADVLVASVATHAMGISAEDIPMSSALGQRQQQRVLEGQSGTEAALRGVGEVVVSVASGGTIPVGMAMVEALDAFDRGELTIDQLDAVLSEIAGGATANAAIAMVVSRTSTASRTWTGRRPTNARGPKAWNKYQQKVKMRGKMASRRKTAQWRREIRRGQWFPWPPTTPTGTPGGDDHCQDDSEEPADENEGIPYTDTIGPAG